MRPPWRTFRQVASSQIGPVAGQGTVQKLADPLVDILAQLRDRAFRDAAEAHGLHQFVHAAGRDAADPCLLDDGDQRLFRGFPGFQEAREIAALPQLRHSQVQRAQTGIESALSIPVPPSGAFAAALMPAGADQPVDIALHDQLQHRLGDRAKEVALIVLGQKLGQVHVGFGHRGLRRVRG